MEYDGAAADALTAMAIATATLTELVRLGIIPAAKVADLMDGADLIVAQTLPPGSGPAREGSLHRLQALRAAFSQSGQTPPAPEPHG